MSRRRLVHSVLVMFLVASAVPALSQTQQFPLQPADKVIEDTADTHPYLDAPFPELKKAVHELAGMTPASSQDQLPDLLDKVGVKADELLQRVPDLVCDEAVSQSQYLIVGSLDRAGKPLGSAGKHGVRRNIPISDPVPSGSWRPVGTFGVPDAEG